MLERVQKIISAAGITSRRAAEQLIIEGRVRVNGQVVTELGTKADASKDHIKVDGKLINPKQPLVYIMLNKPAGYVTTMADPEGRPTVLDLLKGLKIRVYPVGRLDYNTEGLLLLTNDGDFAHFITHPKHEFPKTYRAKVKGVLEDHQIEQLQNGIYLDDGKTAPARLKKISKEEANSWIEITIHEGRKRQVRRMFDRVGHSVIKLKRIKTGNLVLGDLPDGAFRYLMPEEVEALKQLAVKEVKIGPRSPKPEGKHDRTEERVKRPPSKADASFGLWARGSGTRRDAVQGRGPVRATKDEARRPSRGTRATEGHAFAGRVLRENKGYSSTEGRGRPVDRRSESYGEYAGSENKGKSLGRRVPGMGARGRGPRRQSRDEGGLQSSATVFARPASEKSRAHSEKKRRNIVTGRSGHAARSQGASERFGDTSSSKKIIAEVTRGKISDRSTDLKSRTNRTALSSSKDRKPRRAYGAQKKGAATVQGTSRKPYHTRH
jgi:23S rRNA pseudouridine2605 synthase